MREKYVPATGKFQGESPMTQYMYENVQCWDDEASGADGFGAAYRKGKRVLIERTDGFVVSFKFADVADASAYFGVVKEFYQSPALT